MSREAGPKYLGGIGLMLEVAHICPRCGERLPETPSASSWHLAGRGCRPPVFAALPEPEPRTVEDDEIPPVPAGRKIHDFEVPSATPLLPSEVGHVTGAQGIARSLSLPWLRPPDLGEVL